MAIMASSSLYPSLSISATHDGNMKKKVQRHHHHHRSSSSSFAACSSCSAHRLFLLFLGQSLVVLTFVSYLVQHHVQLEKEYQAVQSQLQRFHEKQKDPTAIVNSSMAFASSSSSTNTTSTSSNSSSSSSRNILFVHVGKTGGETVKKVLRIGCEVRKNAAQRADCWKHDFDVSRESKLSQLVHGYFHYRQMHPSDAALVATHYLYTLRHPVQRLQSWFRYITPINCPIPLVLLGSTTKSSNTSRTMLLNDYDPVVNRLVSCRNRQAVVDNPDSWEARFFSCFPTLEFMAKGLTIRTSASDNNANANANAAAASLSRCSRMVRHVLNGQGGGGGGQDTGQDVVGHLSANYQYYHRHTIGLSMPPPPPPPPPQSSSESDAAPTNSNHHHQNRTILVLRTESLWDDLKELDIFLGGNGYFRKEGLRVSHLVDTNNQKQQQEQQQQQQQHKLYKDNAVLSPHGGKLLCCAMHEELAVYRELLLRATNLNAKQKNETLSAALELCRATSWPGLVKACGMQKSKLLEEINVQ